MQTIVLISFLLFGCGSAPRQTATPTIVSAIVPTSTLLPPSATPEPSPTVTLTKTPRPSLTPTLAPGWIRDFAEPILADIRSREPDIQDNFDWNTTFWAPGEWCASRVRVASGVMKMTDCQIEWTRRYENYVATLDLHLSSDDEQFNFYFRRSPSFGGCEFGFQANGGVFWQCIYPDPKNQVRYLVDSVVVKNILVIVQGNRFALYINEKPIEMIQVDVLKYGDISYLGGSGQIDNFKLWRIR